MAIDSKRLQEGCKWVSAWKLSWIILAKGKVTLILSSIFRDPQKDRRLALIVCFLIICPIQSYVSQCNFFPLMNLASSHCKHMLHMLQKETLHNRKIQLFLAIKKNKIKRPRDNRFITLAQPRCLKYVQVPGDLTSHNKFCPVFSF